MNTSAQYQRLPADAKVIMDNFQAGRISKTKLFSEIKTNLRSQTTVKSKAVRRATFRGLLRTYFDMSDKDMKSIEATVRQKQIYFDSNEAGLNNQTESIYNKAVIRRLMTKDILYLLITSGLRVRELLDNDALKLDTGIQFKLNKKGDSDEYFKITPIIDEEEWWAKYMAMKRDNRDKKSASTVGVLNKFIKKIVDEDSYKKSTHLCRALYVKYMHKFRNPENKPLSLFIKKILHHSNLDSSAHYQYAILSENVDNFIE